MARISFVISAFVLILLGFFAQANSINPGVILIGGEYTVQAGETRQGDMIIVFAQVDIENGGAVDGNIHLIGSSLSVKGLVAGKIDSYGSDVSVDAFAQVEREINTIGSVHGLPQLPSILMIIS
jgi:hypothetical protein